MSVTKVQATGSQGTGGSPTATFGSAPTSGNILIAACFQATSTALIMDGTNSTSTGWTRISTVNGGSGGTTHAMALWIKTAGVSESSTVTCFTGSNSGYAVEIAEYLPGGTIGTNVSAATAAFNSGNPQITPSITPTAGQAGVIFAVSAVRSSSLQTWSSVSITGLTTTNEDHQQSANPAATVLYDAFPTSTTGSYQGTATATTNTNGGGVIVFVPVTSGTQNTKTLTGSLPSAGALGPFSTTKLLTASLIASGSLLKNIFHMIIAALLMAGAVTKATVKTAFTAALNSSAALTASHLLFKTLTAALSASGALTRTTGKALSATLIGAGALTRAISRTLTAALIEAGALVKMTPRALSGALSATGALTRSANKILTAALASAGALAKKTAHGLSGALSAAGALTRQTNKALSGAVSATGALTRAITHGITATLGAAGSLTKQTARTLSAALIGAGNLATQFVTGAHNFTQALTASLGLAGSKSVAINKALAGTLVFATSLPKQLSTTISAALIPAGAVFKRTNKNLAGAPPVYALVGTPGAENTTGVTGGDLNNLAWDASETRSANNLLVLAVQCYGTATLPAAPSGWLIATQVAGTGCSASIFYRIASGADSAPTVTGVTGGILFGNLTEFSGNATSSVVDQTQTSSSTASPLVVTMPGTDGKSGELNIWTNASPFSIATAINPITVVCNNGNSHGLAQNPSAAVNHYETYYAITTTNSTADSWTYTPNTTTNITGEATAVVSFKVGSGLISLGLSGSTSRVYGKIFAAALALAGSITRGIAHGVTAALAAAGNLTKFGARSLTGALGLAGNVTKSTLKKAFAATVNFAGTIGTTIFRLSGVTFNAALGLAGNATKFSARTFTGALNLVGSMARAFPVLFSAALGTAGSLTKSIGKSLQASLHLAGAMGKTMYELFTAALSFAGAVSNITGHFVTKLFSAALGLGSRGTYDSLVLGDNPVLYVTTLDTDQMGSHTVTHTGTGSPTTVTLPNGDNAFGFDGATQYISVADANDLSVPTTGALTIEAWVNPSALNMPHSIVPTGYVNLLGKASWWSPPASNQYEYELRYFNQNTTESPSANPPEAFSGYAYNTLNGGIGFGFDDFKGVTVGTWAHLVITIQNGSPSRITIYRDGVQTNTTTFSGSVQNGTAPFTIGANETGELTHSYWFGGIGKVAIYPRVLTATEIKEHWDTMILGPPPVRVLFTQQGKVFGAALNMAGSVKRRVGKAFQGALAASGNVTRKTTHKIAAALTSAANLATSRGAAILKSLTASLGMSGGLTQGHLFSKALAASLAMTGKLTKRTQKILMGAISGVGSLTRIIGGKFRGAMDLPTFLVIKGFVTSLFSRSHDVTVEAKDDPTSTEISPDNTDIWNDG